MTTVFTPADVPASHNMAANPLDGFDLCCDLVYIMKTPTALMSPTLAAMEVRTSCLSKPSDSVVGQEDEIMRKTRVARWAFFVLMGIQWLIAPAMAVEPGMDTHHQKEGLKAVYQAAGKAMQKGPADISIADQAVLRLPAGFGFVPAGEARQLMKAMGNPANDGLQGMIFPTTKQSTNWCIVVNYVRSGHIRDDDAKDWNADDMLTSIRSATEDANQGRRARGLPEIEVLDWVEQPKYDSMTHRLIWAVSSRNKAELKGADHCINYNILVLGRSGYISMNLVTDLSAAEGLEPVARSLIADLSFKAGDRYVDFNANMDKVAEYGLAALVAGVAAQKLGIFALIASFIAKFAKAIGVAVAAGIGLLGKRAWVRKRSDKQPVA